MVRDHDQTVADEFTSVAMQNLQIGPMRRLFCCANSGTDLNQTINHKSLEKKLIRL